MRVPFVKAWANEMGRTSIQNEVNQKMSFTSADSRITKLSRFLTFPLLVASALFPLASEAYQPDSWYIKNECHRKSCGSALTEVKCTVNEGQEIWGHRYEIADGVEFLWLGGLAATYIRYTLGIGSGSYRDFVGREWNMAHADTTNGIYKTTDGQIVMKCTTIK